MNKKQFREEMKSYIVFFAHELDRYVTMYDNDNVLDMLIDQNRSKAIGIAMSMAWSGIFTNEEFEDVNDNMPSSLYAYKEYYDNFVEFYKRWGGEYLESFDRI